MFTVEVLLSTYNGEKFIEKQIKSILSQVNVNVHLTIRDDGSKDDTVKIIRDLSEMIPGKIKLIVEENRGYRKSFLRLLELAEEADFYAFSDQDDIWMDKKLERATSVLSSMRAGVRLYASNVIITDEQLIQIGYNNVAEMPRTIESYFTRSRLAGCTFVFSKELKEYAQHFSNIDYPPEMMPDHDFMVGACALALGELYIDNQSYIYHIRHNDSVTSGGNGLKKRLKVEYQIVFRRKNVRYNVSKLLLREFSDQIPPEQKDFLLSIVSYKNSLSHKICLLTNPKMRTGIMFCDLEQKIKILLGNY